MTVQLSLEAARELGALVLRAAGASVPNAELVAAALADAEADGILTHGLSRLTSYADQLSNGKIDGQAVPVVTERTPSAIHVDAGNGFAYPAIYLGLTRAAEAAGRSGIAGVAIARSQHCGVAGHHVEKLATRGLLALMFGNTPAAIAPWGGAKPLFGTDPVAFACPCAGRAPLVIDFSVARVARGRIAAAAKKGAAIPGGWALDEAGKPTTDAKAALGGTLRAMDDAKGTALALMVELLAGALTGSHFAYEAGGFNAEGPPMGVGQFFLVVDPARFAGPGFAGRVAAMAGAVLDQPGTRLPGDRRLAARQKALASGLAISDDLHADLLRRAGNA